MGTHDRSDMPPRIPGRHSWPARVLYGFVAILVIATGFFFLTVALVAGAIVALVVLARLWWVSRRLRRAQGETEFDGEFAVIERHALIQQVDTTAPDHKP